VKKNLLYRADRHTVSHYTVRTSQYRAHNG